MKITCDVYLIDNFKIYIYIYIYVENTSIKKNSQKNSQKYLSGIKVQRNKI